MKTFAIGDIHGCFELLVLALDYIYERCEGDEVTIIFLGDYFDRGPNVKGVIELLMSEPPAGDTWVILKGNHEEMVVGAHSNPGLTEWWVANGGGATLKSFDGKVPDHVLKWANELPLFHETEFHFFVHAGVDPHKGLKEQDPHILLWMRKFADTYSKHVVHGHTPHGRHDRDPYSEHRTNLDSGAYFSGVLTVAEFDLTKPGRPISIMSIKL